MNAEAYRNFRVAHRLIRRVRVVAPPLVGNVERCYIPMRRRR